MSALFRVKALYEYTSPHEDDLNFPAGQIITVTEEDDIEWYGGEYVDDDGVKKEGIFPRNFVEKFEPTAPPRPARVRPKKEPEVPPPEPEAPEETSTAPPPPSLPAREDQAPVHTEEAEIEELDEPLSKKELAHEPIPVLAPAPAPVPVIVAVPMPSVPKPSDASASITSTSNVPKPKPKPAGPPPPSEKPASNSFRDRIAAFNKPAAPPVAPFKPSSLGGPGGFVKKPFVAPPPSRNAFVPPPREVAAPKIYRREEDPEIKVREAENLGQAEKAGLVPGSPQDNGDEEQPKPTSLKERIALLQKQQMEQAQRHAEAASKKEKPRRPPPMKRPEVEVTEDTEDMPVAPNKLPAEEVDIPISTDEPQQRVPPPPRRKPSKGPAAEPVHDGNEADMSGAGDTTEGQDDTTEREESDETPRYVTRVPTASSAGPQEDISQDDENKEGAEDQVEAEEEEEEEEIDPEVRRKEELRARMAKMSGGMGFHGMFGAPVAPFGAPPPKKKPPKLEQAPIADEGEQDEQLTRAPPVPTLMALPGMRSSAREEATQSDEEEPASATRAPPPPIPASKPTQHEGEGVEAEEDEEDESATPAPVAESPIVSPRDPTSPPSVPGNRPISSHIRLDSQSQLPPPITTGLRSQTEGSESDDELSSGAREQAGESPAASAVLSPRLPPPPVRSPDFPARSPPLSPRLEEFSPTSPLSATSKRASRLPPPIPGPVALPPPAQARPPPPPPPGGLSRQSTAEVLNPFPTRPPQAGEHHDEEVTEYEGDYDTDIASSAPHKDALKAHMREPSIEDASIQSPVSDAPPMMPPPIPATITPRAAPPPIPSKPPPEAKRRSVDAPRAKPPPPPPIKGPIPPPLEGEIYDTYIGSSYSQKTPRIEEDGTFISTSPMGKSPPERRVPPSTLGTRIPPPKPSLDAQRTSTSNRRSVDLHRPSMDLSFIASDVDLAMQSGWWKQANQVPPVLQGRKDIYFECEESTTTNQGSKTIVTREIFVLFQDYSQTVLTVRFDPYDPSNVELDQRHELPPRPLRQDQLEEFYERFGRRIFDAASSKKDTVVGDGTPQSLILELLRPLKDALWPVGTRAYGTLVYANMGNASTQQNDVIRPGDILSIRNAKFQGKHGPMHAKYSIDVGKPDHVAIVAEWDGTKKKLRAWEQGRENKKVKLESFKLDDLRSGEVKIWRVVPRSWIGWHGQP